MNCIEETFNLTNEMFNKGANNNETLQLLLWNLKEILERDKEQLNINQDKEEFLIQFITKLANLYKPTNASQYPSKIVEIHDENEQQIVEITKSFSEVMTEFERFVVIAKTANFNRDDIVLFNELIDSNQSKFMNKCQMLREKITLSNYKIRSMTEQLLIDCRY